MKKISIILICFLITSCSSVTLRTDDKSKINTPPSFQKKYTYWFAGLKGEHKVNIREVCAGQKVTQIQSVATIKDTFFGIITIGIYAPRSARVWCKEKENV